MTRKRIGALSYIGLVACIAALTGCAADSAYDRELYILEAVRDAEPVAVRSDVMLEVNRFSVSAAFAGKNLVYRLDQFAYEADSFREFLIAPGSMISEKTRHWLAASGLFAQVLPPGTRLQPTYTLDGSVTALYGDFRDKAAPTAVVEIRFFLLATRRANETVVFAQTYRTATAARPQSPETLVAALNQGLVEILGRLEADLQKVLARKADAAAPPPR